MSLLSLHDVSLTYGSRPLLEHAGLQIERGERVCLLGRNGEGKSTLMKVLQGEVVPDSGDIAIQKGVRVAYLPQETPREIAGTVFDVVSQGVRRDAGAAAHDAAWLAEHEVNTVISRLKLEAQADFAALSGGMQRRVLLARALVSDPDILLLDEPTNHLDIDSITWLESFLLRYVRTLLFVSHDRVFVRRLATRILEIDRGQLTTWSCDYDAYLQRKTALLEAEAKQWSDFDKKLAQEEEWIRRGVKARLARNQGRVRELMKLRELRQARRERLGGVRVEAQQVERSGSLVIEAKNISFGYGDTPIIRDFSTRIMRGDKVGVIGPNGSGKTTLLRLLLGRLQPQHGKVRLGTRLHVAYFDQMREQLDENKTVQQNISEDNDTVTINGKSRHIIGYLQEFLFTRDRARSPVSVLSGGERNRVLLARLFARPSNVLVMDEPTNDLDVETMELLEHLLLEYPGTLLLVSHDRAFLNNVVTSSLVLEGEGQVNEYAGGYDDWLTARAANAVPEPARAVKLPAKAPKPAGSRPRRLTLAERRELESLSHQIEALEAEQQELYAALGDSSFYKDDGMAPARAKARLEEIELTLHQTYARWQALEELSEAAAAGIRSGG